MSSIEVLTAGPQTLIQDRGRPGVGRWGIGISGAMDRGAFALANRLVGNARDAAGLEILLGGCVIRVAAPTWCAVTGAWGSVLVDGRPASLNQAVELAAGSTLAIGPAERGVRYYLALRGGLVAPQSLGSRARDVLSGLGRPALVDGEALTLDCDVAAPVAAIDSVPVQSPPLGAASVELRPGPRRDWFAESAWQAMLRSPWAVSARSDRSGIRLEGPPLERTHVGELPSEGMIPGAIQVSPDGVPTILGVDHPATGGYPVIAVVTDSSLDTLAQLRPGQKIHFRLATGRS